MATGAAESDLTCRLDSGPLVGSPTRLSPALILAWKQLETRGTCDWSAPELWQAGWSRESSSGPWVFTCQGRDGCVHSRDPGIRAASVFNLLWLKYGKKIQSHTDMKLEKGFHLYRSLS